MERQEIVDQAVEFLRNLDLSKVETLEVNNTNYDDRSTSIEISVMFYPRTSNVDKKQEVIHHEKLDGILIAIIG